MFIQLVLIALGTWLLCYRWQRRRIYKIAREIPSTLKSYPGVGHAYLMKGDGEDRIKFFHQVGRIAIKQGGLSTFWIANKLYVAFADPILAEVIYKNCLHKDDATNKYIRAISGNGIIFAPVSIWRPRRKILAPLFSLRNLNRFVQVFSTQSTIMTKLLKPMAGAGDFSIWKYVTTYTFDSVCETSLGVKLNTQNQPDLPFLTSFDTLFRLVSERMCRPWLHPDLIFKSLPNYTDFVKARQVLYEFVDELIKNKRRELAAKSSEDNQSKENVVSSFMEMMIEQSGGSKGYSDLELREEVLVLLIAGTDTSAVGASYVVVMLSRYPDIQEKVSEELQEVFGDSKRPVTEKDLPRLKYLEAVIKETMRLYPPAPFTAREIHEDVKLPTGTTLVNGVSILLHIWAMHRNPEYWGEDAEKFQPERFLGPLRNPMQFQPFSYFNRNCLGNNYAMMSMKTVLANLLRQYTLLPPSTLDPARLHEPLRVKFDIMMKHVDNYYVRLENRC